jgi:LysM repeat protein
MSASSAFHDTFGRDAFGDYGRPGSGESSRTSRTSRTSRASQASQAGSGGRAKQAKPAPLRLTRRGRFVFIGVPLILLAALVLTFSGFLNAPAKAADSAAELSLTPTVTVTVQPGESLWAIAEAVAPERDPRDVVADIIQLNNLDAARVVPGQALFIPSS